MPELGVFEKILGYKFKNIAYLQNALTHTSYINEHKNNPGGSNERMEFLGDSVLGLSVSDYLYRNYKNLPEGVLSKIRASVVCEDSLAKLAESAAQAGAIIAVENLPRTCIGRDSVYGKGRAAFGRKL